TAAHCFWNKRTGRWSKARYFHFVTGYEKGKYTAVAKGVSFVTAFPVLPNLKKTPLRREDDWAILKLDKPLGAKFGYMKISGKSGTQFLKQAKRNGEFLQAGFSRDYAHVLTVHKNCNMTSFSLLRGSKKPVYIHQCDATQGDSGSPIFYKEKGEYSLVAIHSATGQSSDGTVIGIAVPSRQFSGATTK
ncbi:MAG: trypsin-like serine protease, partial [Sneathiella sp.]